MPGREPWTCALADTPDASGHLVVVFSPASHICFQTGLAANLRLVWRDPLALRRPGIATALPFCLGSLPRGEVPFPVCPTIPHLVVRWAPKLPCAGWLRFHPKAVPGYPGRCPPRLFRPVLGFRFLLPWRLLSAFASAAARGLWFLPPRPSPKGCDLVVGSCRFRVSKRG